MYFEYKINLQIVSRYRDPQLQVTKNTVQALKYPSADAVTLYMPGFKAINWKWERFIKIDKTKMAAAASFSVSHENGQY